MEVTQTIAMGSSASAAKVEEKVKYCLYARKSTESEEQQILSIDSQIKEMLKIAERDGLEIVDNVENIPSAIRKQYPAFGLALHLHEGKEFGDRGTRRVRNRGHQAAVLCCLPL